MSIAQDASPEALTRSIAHPPSCQGADSSASSLPSLRQESQLRARRRFLGGLLVLFVVIGLWVFSSVLTQFLYNDPNTNYAKPTALTTISTATASIFCLPRVFQPCYAAKFRSVGNEDRGVGQHQGQSWMDGDRPSHPFLVAFILTANWFICQWTFNISLAGTALSTNTLLSSSSVVWTYLFSLMFGLARASLMGSASVGFAVIGVFLAVICGEKQVSPDAPQNTVWGIALATGSAMAYGLFSMNLKTLVTPRQMNWLWGAVGVYSIVIGSALMLLLHLLEMEPIAAPSTKALGIMLLNGVFGTAVSDYLWAQGVLLTSPLVATVCLNLTIPVSCVTDSLLLQQHSFSWYFPLGAAFVFAGVASGAVEEAQRLDSDTAAELQGAECASESRMPTSYADLSP